MYNIPVVSILSQNTYKRGNGRSLKKTKNLDRKCDKFNPKCDKFNPKCDKLTPSASYAFYGYFINIGSSNRDSIRLAIYSYKPSLFVKRLYIHHISISSLDGHANLG